MSSSWISKDQVFRGLKSAQIVLNLTNSHGWWRRDTWNKCRFSFNWCCCSCCLWCKSQYADTIWRVFQLCYAKFLKNLARNKKKLVKWMMTSRDTWNKCRFNFNWCCCCLWCNSQYAEIVYYNYNASDSSKDLIRFRIFRKDSSFSIFFSSFILFTTQFCSALSQNISGSQFKLDKVNKLFLIVLSNC